MAYPTVEIKTITLFAGTGVGALGTSGTVLSDPIDLREIATMNRMSVSYRITPRGVHDTAGALASCGSATFRYLASNTRDGVYVPESPTYGTSLEGGSGGTGLWEFSPRLTPFMKIDGVFGSSGGAKVSAELNVQ